MPTEQIRKEKQLLRLIEITKKYIGSSAADLSYQSITEDLLVLSLGKYAAFNLYNENGDEFTTVSTAGIAKNLTRAAKLLGYDLNGKRWPADPVKNAKTEGRNVTVFEHLHELTHTVIAKSIVQLIETTFQIGQVAVIKVMKDNSVLGDFTLFMPKNAKLESVDILIIFASQVGLFLDKRRVEKELQTALSDTANNFRLFFETVDDLIIVTDKQGEIKYTNQAFYKKLGYSQDEIASMHLLDFHPLSLRDEARQIYGDMLLGKRTSCPLPLNKKSGTFLPVETRLWLGEWNGEECVFGVSKDLTKEQESLQKFNKLFENNPALMAVSSIKDRTFIDVNEAFVKTLGYTRDEVLGKTTQELNIFCEPEKHVEFSKILSEEGRIHEVDMKLRTKSGQLLDGLFSGEIIKSQDNTYFLTVMTDITERKKYEQELKDTTEELERFFSVNLDLLCIADTQGHFIRVNKSWEGILGYSQEQLEGCRFLDFVHPDDIAKTLDTMAAIDKKEEVLNFVNRYRCVDGSYKYIEWRSTPYDNLIYAAARDITGQIKLNEQLSNQKEQFELAIRGSNDGIWDWNLATGEHYISPRWKEQLGYADDELPNVLASFVENIHPDDIARVNDTTKRYIDGELNNYDLDIRMRHKDGSYRWIWARGEALRDSQGKAIRIAGSHTDVTEKRQADDARRESERYLRTILDTTQDGFWVIEGLDGRVSDVNEAYCRMSGYTKDELIGTSISHTEAVENPEETAARFNRIIENGSEIFETQHRRKDGSLFDVEISVTCMSRDPIKMVCFCRDITRRISDQEALEHSHNLMRYIIEHNRSAVAIHDKDLNYLYVSQNYLDSYGIKEADVIGKHHYEVFPDLPQKWRDVHQRALKGEILSADDDSYIHADGSVDWTRWECRAWYEKDGSVGGIIVYTEVINERKKMEQMILDEKEHFRTTLLSVGDAVISTDRYGHITVMNKVAEKLTGWTMEAALGLPSEQVFHVIHEFTKEPCENPVQKVLDFGEIVELASHTMLIAKDGQEVPIEDSAAPIKNSRGEITGVVLVFRDFTEKREKQKQVEFLSYHDQLTGLYNRRYFEEELKRLDNKRNLPLTLVMLDVNGLKLTNDAFGHRIGDVLLTTVSDIIKSVCREDEIMSRIGGDEFVILLPKTDEAQTQSLMKRLNQAFANTKVEGIQISVSSGWATKRQESENIIHTFKTAEDQMYRDKISDRSSQRYETIQLIMKTLHEKIPRERLHSQRVCEICEQIGRALKLDANAINELTTTAELHDIGKIAIGNEILDKSGSLSDLEWFEIKRHPEVGFNILSSVNAYAPLADIVLTHHERWDGKGYPNGLTGEEIPFNARIIMIADTFDAMTKDRPYRKALSESEALAEIRHCSGTQFDPRLVDVFIKLMIAAK